MDVSLTKQMQIGEYHFDSDSFLPTFSTPSKPICHDIGSVCLQIGSEEFKKLKQNVFFLFILFTQPFLSQKFMDLAQSHFVELTQSRNT